MYGYKLHVFFLLLNKKENSILAADLKLSEELGFDLFVFKKEDFEKNPYLERDLRNIFKILNKENKNISIYDLKFYYLFLYNLYIEKKIILRVYLSLNLLSKSFCWLV